jgi:hypothetical protein
MTVDTEHLENVEYGIIKHDARCKRETKARIIKGKAAFSENNTLFTIN